ncbi:MAG: protein-disulfide reductase DsbD domain-containing protein [Verrucomicrobiota bacterium]
MRFQIACLVVGFAALANGAAKASHAQAGWFAASSTWQPGKPVVTAVRVTIEDGWHIYWSNPGESGIATTISVIAPKGWKVGEVGIPVPVRFKTGELAGFGYEKEVWFPVTLTPGPGAQEGVADFEAKAKWLTCNESACVPGEAKMTLSLVSGADPAAGKEAAAVTKSLENIPVPAKTPVLSVAEADGKLTLTLTAKSLSWKPEQSRWFPATQNVVDSAAEIRFTRSDDVWSATVPKNEYAEGPVEELALVAAGGGLKRPVTLSWKRPAKR